MGANPTCQSCGITGQCGKGCPAAVIAAGERIGAVDADVCPVTTRTRRLLPLAPA
jgi:radical SAM protein with 4Fe4S-binding SPASM domain